MSIDPILGALNPADSAATPVPASMPAKQVCPTAEAQSELDRGLRSATSGEPGSASDSLSSAVLAAALQAGTIIDGRYRVDALLGAGGMSVVYKAYHLNLDRAVALKMLHPHLLRERRVIERFLQEARAESALHHSNIVAAQAIGATEQGQPFLVMDYLEGRSLAQLLKERVRLDEHEAVPIFKQICAGLAHAHARGVVHRDLKPSNIMLIPSPAGQCVKIVDFGIARLLHDDDDDDRQHLTTTGMIVGSPCYMSPEQCLGNPVDQRSDIYSLGCLMYETLTGHVPIEGGTVIDTMRRQVSENAAPFSAANADILVSNELEDAVFRAMRKKARDRFADVNQLAEALASVQTAGSAQYGLMVESARDFRTVPIPTRKRTSPIRSVVALAVAIFAGTAALAFTARQPLWLAYEKVVVLPSLQSEVSPFAANSQMGSPSAAPAVVRLADCLYDLDRRSDAAAAYRSALTNIALAPHSVRDRAVDLLVRAYPNNPALFVVAAQKAAAQFIASGQLSDAEAVLRQAVRYDGAGLWAQISAYDALVDLLIRRKQYDTALAVAAEAIKLAEPVQSPAGKSVLSQLYIGCGEAQLGMDRTAEAIRAYQRALALEPQSNDDERLRKALTAKRLSEICWSNREYEATLFRACSESAALFNQSNSCSPTDLAAVYKLAGDAHSRGGDQAQAEVSYRAALRLLLPLRNDRQLCDTKHALADCLYRQSRFHEARLLYIDALVWMNQAGDATDAGMVKKMIHACSH